MNWLGKGNGQGNWSMSPNGKKTKLFQGEGRDLNAMLNAFKNFSADTEKFEFTSNLVNSDLKSAYPQSWCMSTKLDLKIEQRLRNHKRSL